MLTLPLLAAGHLRAGGGQWESVCHDGTAQALGSDTWVWIDLMDTGYPLSAGIWSYIYGNKLAHYSHQLQPSAPWEQSMSNLPLSCQTQRSRRWVDSPLYICECGMNTVFSPIVNLCHKTESVDLCAFSLSQGEFVAHLRKAEMLGHPLLHLPILAEEFCPSTAGCNMCNHSLLRSCF